MRIVGGEFRGRTIASPKSNAIRPTSDRVRESLFNILNHTYLETFNGIRVLDLFAGTGALGLEALSRGAEFALFVEQGIEGRGLLRTNIEAFGLQGRSKVFRRDASSLGAISNLASFDLIFADPPYNKGLGERAMINGLAGGWFSPDALFVLEEEVACHPDQVPGFEQIDKRQFGSTAMSFWRVITQPHTTK